MRFRVLAITATLAMALAACSGGSDDSAEASGDVPAAAEGAATFVGTDNLQWEETSKSATLVDGALEVTIMCRGAVPHNVVVEGVLDDAPITDCSGDDSATETVEVEPGTYTYYCSIPGHREAGMEGEIAIS